MAKSRRFQEILDSYSDKYDLATLSSPNDRANLEMLINNQVIVESIQAKLQELTEDDPVENIDIIQRLGSSLKDIIERNLQLERALALDRKTRNTNTSESVAEYLVNLKQVALDFLEKRLLRVYCPDCKIMVARLSIVQEHSPFSLRVKCSQCEKDVIIEREEKDIFFDVADSAWRRKYQYKVQKAKKTESSIEEVEDDLLLVDPEEDSDAHSEAQ
jgi:hypothetical protein